MSSKIVLLSLFQYILIIGIIIFFYSVFSPKKTIVIKTKSITKSSIWKSFDIKTIIAIVLASAGITWFLSSISGGIISKFVIFITITSFAPYFLINNANRIKHERIFKDIMIYCSNTAILLKQNYTVPEALGTVAKDLGPELGNDVEALKESFRGDKYGNNVKKVMDLMEKKYPYSCINNLNIILLIRHYDASKDTMPDALYDTYQDDIAMLEQDINENKQKRNSMRLMYFGLTIGGFLMYMYFYNDMSARLGDIYNTPGFRLGNLIYTFVSLVILFMVDRYFNGNTSKE